MARRQDRLEKLAVAKAKDRGARGGTRYAQELTEHEAKLAAREAKTAATAKSPAANHPSLRCRPVAEGSDPDLTNRRRIARIMPVAGGGFERCYNAQAVVTADSMLVIAADVVQAPNDKRQIEPMPNQIRWVTGLIG